MKRALISIYKSLFVRKAFYRFHSKLLNLSLWGLGVLNSEHDRLSGEAYFLGHAFAKSQDITVLDIGANVGAYANLAKSVYPKAHVYAFEPHPVSYATLQEQASQHGYQAFNLAISNSVGAAKLYNYREGEGSAHASLYREVLGSLRHANASSMDVAVTTIDQFLHEHRLGKVDLLKIDTEGNELNVLQGAHTALADGAVSMIQFEFNEMNVISHSFMRDFFQLLPQFVFYRMLPDGLVPLSLEPTFLAEIFAFQNIVARRTDLGAWNV